MSEHPWEYAPAPESPEIAGLRPSSMSELARIKGVGPAFVERHGEAVLGLVEGAL